MSVPEVFIRDDGKGFIVRKGGIDFDVNYIDSSWEAGSLVVIGDLATMTIPVFGYGDTVMQAVDNAILKMTGKE
jgi:hypothetical protein